MSDPGTVEKVAEAIWFASHGRHRPGAKWPEGVIGGSQELFRNHARAALSALSTTDPRTAALVEAAKLFKAGYEGDDDRTIAGYHAICAALASWEA